MEVLRKCKCGVEANCKSDLELFSKRPNSLYGRRNLCKKCDNLKNKQYYSSNVEKKKVYYLTNIKRIKEYRALNAEHIREYTKKYRQENLEYFKIKSEEWREDNKDYERQRYKNYYLINSHFILVKNAKRRAAKLIQTPELSFKEIKAITNIYYLAKELSNTEKITYHVDHIVPISRGGLHHPLNLQVLTAEENLKKSNHLPKTLPRSLVKLHSDYYGTTDDWSFSIRLT